MRMSPQSLDVYFDHAFDHLQRVRVGIDNRPPEANRSQTLVAWTNQGGINVGTRVFQVTATPDPGNVLLVHVLQVFDGRTSVDDVEALQSVDVAWEEADVEDPITGSHLESPAVGQFPVVEIPTGTFNVMVTPQFAADGLQWHTLGHHFPGLTIAGA